MTTMVGIISKHEHIKAHIAALMKAGFEVRSLGDSPTQIPDNVKILVLRTESCSRLGSETAFSWRAKTGKPLVVENGQTGMMQRVLALAEHPPSSTQKPKTFTFPTGSPPEKADWTLVEHPMRRLEATHRECLELWPQIPDNVRELLFRNFKTGAESSARGTPSRVFPQLSVLTANSQDWVGFNRLGGRPSQFFLTMQWILLQKGVLLHRDFRPRDLQRAYTEFCGKGSVKSCVEATQWLMAHEVPGDRSQEPVAKETLPAEPVVLEPQAPVEKGVPTEPLASGTISRTGAILELELAAPAKKPEPWSVRGSLDEMQATLSETQKTLRGMEDLLLEDAETSTKLRTELSQLKAAVVETHQENTQLQIEVQRVREALSASTLLMRELFFELSSQLKDSGRAHNAPQDSFSVLESLRDRGATISIVLEKK